MDRISSQARSANMARIRSRGNRTTERRLRAYLVCSGITGWKLHPAQVSGQPDFIFPKLSLALFVDGCFWHVCPKCGHVPKSNSAYWRGKLRRNISRDRKVTARLIREGWRVIRIWEHDVKVSPRSVVRRIIRCLGRDKQGQRQTGTETTSS